jgi:hypothetical protein
LVPTGVGTRCGVRVTSKPHGLHSQLYLRLPWDATCVDRMARARDFDLVTVDSRGILAFEFRG